MRNRALIWIALGVFAVIVRWILGFFPQIVEKYYTQGLFLGFRKAFDIITIVPLPFVYLVLGGILVALGLGIIRLVRSKSKIWNKIGHGLLSLGAFLGGAIFFFLLFWGYNYARLPIEKHLQLSLTPLSKENLEKSLDQVIPLVREKRISFGIDSVSVMANDLPENLSNIIRADLQNTLKRLGYPYQFAPKVRQLQPRGVLLRFNTLGVYFPWTGECNIDAGLHPLEKPFVMAHEMAHGYGFSDEGTCNFLAYLACIQSKNSFIQYAGYFEYFSTIAVNYRKYDREAYTAMMRTMPAAVKADWNSIIENHERYPNIMPKLRHYTYDTYLKVQGISEGIQNYNRVLMLVKAWEAKENSSN